ncbi:AAA family ATPase [Caldalkalibacillus mannanilyticus]|uniref:AAA family ATPase n=1 Tax=Caldalkalibacillus mannanilyticus TaxID=1418 RepID=UPI00046869A5|nr:AAA family ATPase [Caldalkalibacillus mannanilyticus]
MSEAKIELEKYQQIINSIKHEMEKRIVGQKEVIEQILWAICSGGHVLLEGVPGLGKTLMVHALAQTMEMSFQRIQFTPDLMPADILGTNILQISDEGKQRFQFQYGPIFAHVVLADEINRATPKTQSALLEAMQERTVTAGGETRPLPAPFFVLATQNPLEQEGTYPLPEAQLDRFILKVHVPFPTVEELKQIVQLTESASSTNTISPVAEGAILQEIKQVVKELLVAEPVLDYAVKLLMATHPEQSQVSEVVQYVKAGAGPRGLQAMIATAKIRAFLHGRYNVSFADIEAVAFPTLRHRIFLNFEGEATGVKTDQIIQKIIDSLENEK